MHDTEFTVEEGRLYMLQTRNAKRPAQAAVRFAVDSVAEGLLTVEEAIATIDAASLDALLHPAFSQKAEYSVLARGVNASPGAAKGEIVFTAEDAVSAQQQGRDVVLVRPFTEADDVAGFYAAKGVLTSEGGKASHAALVARGMGCPCVCGASALDIDLSQHKITAHDGTELGEGDLIAIDGTSGVVTVDDVALVEPEVDENLQSVLKWCDDLRSLSVRANADTPEDASKARGFGAQGVGLCRTEHMFMAGDRQSKMRAMIMADTEADRRWALQALLPMQQQDFEGLFEQMTGLPVTIRLFDPPLHEFVPSANELAAELATAQANNASNVSELQATLERVRALEETNPMLGTRGCRLGILYPEIYEMQAEAIIRAAQAVNGRTGSPPVLEIMIPLVAYERELEIVRKLVTDTADKAGREGLEVAIGTMIELPRACFVADRIATVADFFSFGTNDLTQTAIGLSRDDVEGRFLSRYIDQKIVDRSPFETIDQPGVGELLQVAVERGRSARPDLHLGICGEHGGDPDSIRFFHKLGLDYVSASPYRVPIARVAAAQAAIKDSKGS
jgi:pyruvate,orthophosphate dikinase